MSSSPSSAKVLVVDDDRIVLQCVSEWLERAGYDVVVRDEALGTTSAVQREQPDVVVLDVNMPALSGTRLAELIAGQPQFQSVRVIFYSADPIDATQALARRLGALGAIQKTGRERDFVSAFVRLVEGRERS